MDLDPKEFIQSQIYYIGLYEHYYARYFEQFLSPGLVCIDVGAHVGQYALIAAAAGMEAHAFEPDPQNFGYLKWNVLLNNLNVRLNLAAVSDFTGEATLFPYGDESIRNNSLRPIQGARQSSRSEITTPVVHLDGYFEGRHDQVHLIKADVEGAELSVLRGAETILQKSRPVLFLELVKRNANAFGYTPRDLKQFLSNFGYRFFAVHRRSLKSIPIASDDSFEKLICKPAHS